MPGFTLHYLFGTHMYYKMQDGKLKNLLKQTYPVYATGLQGPDFFFYYLPCYLYKNNIGSTMHKNNTRKFFYYALAYRETIFNPKEKNVITAYIAGFLGHYTLDRYFHPYIYEKTGFHPKNKKEKSYYGKHFEMETALDSFYLKKLLNKSPKEFNQWKTIDISSWQRRVIARMLNVVLRKTYGKTISISSLEMALYSMFLGTRFLHDNTGKKKSYIQTVEKILFGHPILSYMIASEQPIEKNRFLNLTHKEWTNPWNEKLISVQSVTDLMKQSCFSYKDLLEQFQYYIEDNTNNKSNLLKIIGNKSYHSGLEKRKESILY